MVPVVDDRRIGRVWAEEKPSVIIGKEGVDEGVVREVRRQLKRRGVIKVRVLRSALVEHSFEELVGELAARTSSRLCGRRGRVVVLARR